MLWEPRYRRRAGALASLATAAGAGYRYFPGGPRAMGKIAKSYYKSYSKGQNQKGGAAPIKSTNSSVIKNSRQRRRRKAQKCKNLKGYALKKKVCALENKVSNLSKSAVDGIGTLTYRRVRSSAILGLSNQQGSNILNVNRVADLETVLGSLLYYDPAVPGTLVTASGASGTYQKDFLFKSVYSTITVRNNYQSDCKLSVYLCKSKNATSTTPTQDWDSGVADNPGASVTSRTDPGQFPTDYKIFNQTWNAKRMASKILSPGESVNVSHSVKDIDFNPAYYDVNTEAFQPNLKSFVWLVVIEGLQGHDPTLASTIGLTPTGVDIIQRDTYKVQYDAGVSIDYVVLDNTLQLAGTLLQSHQPVVDNQPYSQS